MIASDFATPLEVFSRACLPNGSPCYEVKLCGVTKTVHSNGFSITVPSTLSGFRRADTIIVPGSHNPFGATPPELKKALVRAHEGGARIASICTGAFALADTGLLRGYRATTHWAVADALAEQYPEIDVDPNVLYVDNGQVLTSAGAVAGLDLCLHMIRKDFGAAVAAQSARASVMPLERDGGQAQFIRHQPVVSDRASLKTLLVWIENNLSNPLMAEALAEHSAMSVRTLHRRFLEQTGTTPSNWVLRARIRSAQHMLESSHLTVDQVSRECGFGSISNFRTRFSAVVGVSPIAYRKAFRMTD